MIPDRNDVTLSLVRELGFDRESGAAPFDEKVYFLGPSTSEGRTVGAHATEEAIREFVAYWSNQIKVAEDYLANGRTNSTLAWAEPKAKPVAVMKKQLLVDHEITLRFDGLVPPGKTVQIEHRDSITFRAESAKRVEGVDYSAFTASGLWVGVHPQWPVVTKRPVGELFTALRYTSDAMPLPFGYDMERVPYPLEVLHPGLPLTLVVTNNTDQPMPFAIVLVGKMAVQK